MAGGITVTHTFVSTAAVSASTDKVQSTHWNANHTIAVATDSVIPAKSQKDFWSGLIVTPTTRSYDLARNVPYAGTIDNTTVFLTAGTASITFTINGTSIGGTGNSASTSQDSQSHSSANAFSSGDNIGMSVTAQSSSSSLAFTIAITKSLSS